MRAVRVAALRLFRFRNRLAAKEKMKNVLKTRLMSSTPHYEVRKIANSFNLKTQRQMLSQKASMECSLFALLRWLRADEKKETLLKTLLVEKWIPRALEARNGTDSITSRWVDVAAKTLASLASKPTAFPQGVVMKALESLGEFWSFPTTRNPSRGTVYASNSKQSFSNFPNKGALVSQEVHEKMLELKMSFANAIQGHEEKHGGTDDTFLALAIETLSPDSFGGADEVASFIGRVTMNRKQKREDTIARGDGATAVVDTTSSIESLFAALKFASAETWSKHCEHIFEDAKARSRASSHTRLAQKIRRR